MQGYGGMMMPANKLRAMEGSQGVADVDAVERKG